MRNSIIAVSPGRLPYYMAMKMQSIGNHHSERSTASSNNNRLLIYCQAVFNLFLHKHQNLQLNQGNWRLIALLALLTGLGIRLWLVLTNPLWSDEMYSIWAASQPWSALLSGDVDLVHPPLYYLFLKVWMQVSDQLQWLRTSSLLASLGSMFCLYHLGKTELKHHESNSGETGKTLHYWWPVAYSLSGFHIVFDWSVRMYALVTLLSLATLLAVRKKSRPLLLFVLACAGLLLDYAYVWSYILIWWLAFYHSWRGGNRRQLATLIGLTLGAIPFLIWQCWRWPYFQAGLNGILWMSDVLYPSFFLPFFLGTHANIWLTGMAVMLISISLWTQRRHLIHYPIVWWLLGGSLLILESTYIFSMIKQPLLHPRSLQIVGITMCLIWGVALHQKLRGLGLLILITGAFAVPILFQRNSLKLLTEFYPWKNTRNMFASQLEHEGSTLFITPHPESPSPLLHQGLLYTLNGKERLGDKPIPFMPSQPTDNKENCKVIWNLYVVAHLCQ